MNKHYATGLAVLMLLCGASVLQAAQPVPHAARLTALEDREAIRLVLRDYGRLLDLRRFDDFGRLFAADGEYVSAGRTMRGPAEIAESLRRTFAGNSLGLGEPNFHVLFNERIELAGDRAQATSQSFYVAPAADGAPRIVMMASYDDTLVRTPDGWRFARRVVRGDLFPRPVARDARQP
jgi:hypothetical protein